MRMENLSHSKIAHSTELPKRFTTKILSGAAASKPEKGRRATEKERVEQNEKHFTLILICV